MCQPKDKGGKRCFTHMMGTMASITMASVMSGLEESFVTKVTRSLRKEGKNLPAPTEEEIVAFARNNQFISKHDSSIPENKRAMLVRRWQKAEMEKPDGAGFHAWKHTLVESVVRWKRTSMAIGLAGIIATTSACSGGALENNSPTDTSTPTTITQTTQAPTPSMVPTTPVVKDNTVKLGSVVKTTKGEYRQVELPDNSPALKYNPAIVQPVVSAKYSEAEIQEGKKAIMDFAVKEVIDSPLNGGGETKAQWWARNKDKFTPAAATDVEQNLNATNADGTSKSLPSDEVWQQTPEYKGYEYTYNANTPRVKNLQVIPTEVFLDDNGSIAVSSNVSYEMPYTFKDKSGDMKVSGTMAYSAVKENGKWLIAGFNRSTTTASTGLK